jgi:hypothetical protein
VWCAETQSKIPAMVAAVVNLEGRQIATHRTYLKPDGSGKATVLEAKKALGKYAGGFIPLWKGEHDCALGELPPGTAIYISEGIEDGLSVALARPSLRVIAAISLSNLGALELPHGIARSISSASATKRCARSKALAARSPTAAGKGGHDVFLIFPPQGVKDYNELLQRDGAAE